MSVFKKSGGTLLMLFSLARRSEVEPDVYSEEEDYRYGLYLDRLRMCVRMGSVSDSWNKFFADLSFRYIFLPGVSYHMLRATLRMLRHKRQGRQNGSLVQNLYIRINSGAADEMFTCLQLINACTSVHTLVFGEYMRENFQFNF